MRRPVSFLSSTFSMHLFDCCVSSAVARCAPSSIPADSHCDAVPPLPPPLCIDRALCAAAHLPLSYRVAVVQRERVATVHLPINWATGSRGGRRRVRRHYNYPLSHGVSIICDICGSADVSRVS